MPIRWPKGCLIAGSLLAVFQPGNLPPDEYTREVTVVDRKRKKEALVRQEIDFGID